MLEKEVFVVVDFDVDNGVDVGEKFAGIEAAVVLLEACIMPSRVFVNTIVPSGGTLIGITAFPPVEL